MKLNLKTIISFFLLFVFSFFVQTKTSLAIGVWTEQTASGQRNWTSIASSSNGMNLSATDSGGYIYTSTDGGVSWIEQTASGQRYWMDITSSSDGMKLAAVGNGTYIYTSTDGGNTWTEQTASGQRNWTSIASSSNGMNLSATDSGGYIYTSTDGGNTWTEQTASGQRNWTSIASSSDGVKLVAVDNNYTEGGYIYTSIDGGVNWTEQVGSDEHSWSSVASSSDGTKLIAGTFFESVYVSYDSGETWSEINSIQGSFVSSSYDGLRLAAVSNGSLFTYTPANLYSGWIEQLGSYTCCFSSVASSANGTKLIATDSGGYIYTFEADVLPPTISSLFPLNGAINVSVDSNLQIVFNEDVFINEGSIYIYKTEDDSLFEEILISDIQSGDGTNTITINPTNNFKYNTEYYILTDSGIVFDFDRNNFEGILDSSVWSFKTKKSGSTGGGGSGGGVDNCINCLPPPIDPCATDPSLCLPPPIDPPVEPVDPCATDPSLCLPPPIDPCATDPSLCLPPPIDPPVEPVDPCVLNPSLCLPPPIDPCATDPSLCLVIEPQCQGIFENIKCNIIDSFVFVKDTFSETFEGIKEIINSPTGDVIVKTIGIVGITFGSIFSVLPKIFATPFSFSEIILLPYRIWSAFTSFFGFRKRIRPWGTVYDSVTKQPLDPVIVSLQDINGQEIQTSITDMDGRYGFLVGPGKYRLLPKKTNYSFPSLRLVGKTRDEIYNDLYFGYIFEIKSEGEVVIKNIPMDPIGFDWNEFTKKDQKLMKFYSKRDLVLTRISDMLFSFGFFVSTIAIISSTTFYNILIFIIYLLLLFLRETGLKINNLGKILDINETPLSFAVLKVYEATTGVLISKKVSNKYGQYYCLVQQGNYFVEIDKKNLDESYITVYKSGIINAQKGFIKETFKIK